MCLVLLFVCLFVFACSLPRCGCVCEMLGGPAKQKQKSVSHHSRELFNISASSTCLCACLSVFSHLLFLAVNKRSESWSVTLFVKLCLHSLTLSCWCGEEEGHSFSSPFTTGFQTSPAHWMFFTTPPTVHTYKDNQLSYSLIWLIFQTLEMTDEWKHCFSTSEGG